MEPQMSCALALSLTRHCPASFPANVLRISTVFNQALSSLIPGQSAIVENVLPLCCAIEVAGVVVIYLRIVRIENGAGQR